MQGSKQLVTLSKISGRMNRVKIKICDFELSIRDHVVHQFGESAHYVYIDLPEIEVVRVLAWMHQFLIMRRPQIQIKIVSF